MKNLSEMLGLRMPGGLMYSTCVPGAQHPEFYLLPAKWMPEGYRQHALLTLEESYRLSEESYRPVADEDGQIVGRESWLDQARRLRPHERPCPPAEPGFWDCLHFSLNPSAWTSRRLERAIGGMLQWIGARGGSDARAAAEAIRRLAAERGVQS